MRYPRREYAAAFACFSWSWRANDWNHFRIRGVGRLPFITTWIIGLTLCELDIAQIETPAYDPELVFARLSRAGHLGLEVHEVNLKNPLS